MAFLLNGHIKIFALQQECGSFSVGQWRPLLAMSSFVDSQFSRLPVVSVIFR